MCLFHLKITFHLDIAHIVCCFLFSCYCCTLIFGIVGQYFDILEYCFALGLDIVEYFDIDYLDTVHHIAAGIGHNPDCKNLVDCWDCLCFVDSIDYFVEFIAFSFCHPGKSPSYFIVYFIIKSKINDKNLIAKIKAYLYDTTNLNHISSKHVCINFLLSRYFNFLLLFYGLL